MGGEYSSGKSTADKRAASADNGAVGSGLWKFLLQLLGNGKRDDEWGEGSFEAVEGLSGEARLLLAVYYRAVQDYRAWKNGLLPPEDEEWGADAEWWLFVENNPQRPGSLAWICEALSLDIEKMRRWAEEADLADIFAPCALSVAEKKRLRQQKEKEDA